MLDDRNLALLHGADPETLDRLAQMFAGLARDAKYIADRTRARLSSRQAPPPAAGRGYE